MSATCGKAMYSVMFCISATGNCLPPFVVYKGLHLYNTWTSGGPPGCVYATTPIGWMQDNAFENWFKDFFIQSTQSNQKPVLLIYDGHGSHLTYNTVMLAIENNIIIICLPPNWSHALQPLDVSVFKNLKEEWKKILKQWFRKSRLPIVDKAVFPGLLNRLRHTLSADDAVVSFRGSGIVPLELEKMKWQIVLPKEMGYQTQL